MMRAPLAQSVLRPRTIVLPPHRFAQIIRKHAMQKFPKQPKRYLTPLSFPNQWWRFSTQRRKVAETQSRKRFEDGTSLRPRALATLRFDSLNTETTFEEPRKGAGYQKQKFSKQPKRHLTPSSCSSLETLMRKWAKRWRGKTIMRAPLAQSVLRPRTIVLPLHRFAQLIREQAMQKFPKQPKRYLTPLSSLNTETTFEEPRKGAGYQKQKFPKQPKRHLTPSSCSSLETLMRKWAKRWRGKTIMRAPLAQSVLRPRTIVLPLHRFAQLIREQAMQKFPKQPKRYLTPLCFARKALSWSNLKMLAFARCAHIPSGTTRW
ncbi:hypothetical protein LF1_02190 [Rubripirellula obstinata]|uniref:Uncharacterized protein n=2 Tax=Rubripirellula obstinata TaxID=406547 RepID=A0A5B1CDQ8_9BACT|nr:hypothetical protein LF1_02190 [Rubripirellula obstinata]